MKGRLVWPRFTGKPEWRTLPWGNPIWPGITSWSPRMPLPEASTPIAAASSLIAWERLPDDAAAVSGRLPSSLPGVPDGPRDGQYPSQPDGFAPASSHGPMALRTERRRRLKSIFSADIGRYVWNTRQSESARPRRGGGPVRRRLAGLLLPNAVHERQLGHPLWATASRTCSARSPRSEAKNRRSSGVLRLSDGCVSRKLRSQPFPDRLWRPQARLHQNPGNARAGDHHDRVAVAA